MFVTVVTVVSLREQKEFLPKGPENQFVHVCGVSGAGSRKFKFKLRDSN